MFRLVQRRDRRIIALACALAACTEGIRLGVDDRPVEGIPSDVAGPGASSGAGPLQAGAAGAFGEFPLAGAGGSLADAPAPVPDAGPCTPLPCGGMPQQCGDCIDNDGDSRSDASDPECLGPCDDSELEFQSGHAANVSGSCRADCYFDRNTGSGDDRCGWSYRCDPLSLGPDFDPTGSSMCQYDPALASCSGSELGPCLDTCLPLTPNGCDCFGCCELPAASDRFVWLGAGDGDRPCTQAPDCVNPCDDCELCVGKTELPASCGGAVAPNCREGVRDCDPQGPSGCGSLDYCITGCCVPLPT
jgi:hypothetical protein